MPRFLREPDITEFRNQVCIAARKIFAEAGYEGLTMRRLAARLGVSVMTAYRYFDDKDAILAALRTRAFAQLADTLEIANDAGGSARDRMVRIRRSYLEFAREDTNRYRLMFELSCASQTPCREQQRVHDAFANHGRYLVRAGLLDGDPELFDRSLWSWLHGAASLHSMGLCPDDDLDRLVVETACNVASLNGNRIKTSNIASVACSALAVEHYPLPPRLADVLCG